MAIAVGKQDEQGVPDQERAAACALAGLAGIGTQSFALIRAAFGSLAAAVGQGGSTIANTAGLRADGIESLRTAPDLGRRGQWLLEKARQLGARVLLREDAEYPELLRQIPGGPPVLYVQGTLSKARRVAVVGTRRPDDYGIARTQAIVDQLCSAGVEVVSGGALGVDTVAHERALARGGRTMAVIGSGLLKLYPSENRQLFERLMHDGVIVTEFALDSPGITTHFPQRNRTMAGLSEAVVITRGDTGSGALTTCQSATKFGRPVFAVPGQVGDRLAAAPHAQLSGGFARALITGTEVLDTLGLKSNLAPEAASLPAPRIVSTDHLPKTVQQVYLTLGPAPRHVDDIALAAGLATAETLSALLRLELDGLCATRPGKYFLRR